MNAGDFIIKRRNGANTGWVETLVSAAAFQALKLDAALNPFFQGTLQATPTAVTGQSKTLTAAQLATGFIQDTVITGAATDTTDTAANIIAAIPALASPGAVFECILQNTAATALTITMAGGSGVTVLNAGTTIAQNAAGRLRFTSTSATTLCMSIG